MIQDLEKLLSQMGNWDIYFEQMDPDLFRKDVREHGAKLRQIITTLEQQQERDLFH